MTVAARPTAVGPGALAPENRIQATYIYIYSKPKPETLKVGFWLPTITLNPLSYKLTGVKS